MIEITNSGVWNHCTDGVIRGILFEPHPCGCGKRVYFVVNRDGRSRCVDCDAEYTQRRATHANG
jgi:hypothetical protein